MVCSICTKHKESFKRMVWLLSHVSFSAKTSFVSMSNHDANKAEAMAVASRHSSDTARVCLPAWKSSACMEE